MLFRAVPDRALDEILSQVSRSFYLSLAVLPRRLRAQLSAAYLVARAADTIADTRLVRAERRIALLGGMRAAIADRHHIAAYVAEVNAETVLDGVGEEQNAERLLLVRLGDCLERLGQLDAADRERSRRVLDTLITGMERDLVRFPSDGEAGLVALETPADLDEYTYMAAGCVGEYWTLMTAAHVPVVKRLARPDFVARGVRLGKALQLINVIRDAAADLRLGRCYIPRQLLERHDLEPRDLMDAQARLRARPLLDELRVVALGHVDAAFPYVMAIPRWEPRLRLAALWPLWIGLATLERLAVASDPLDPARPVKIARGDVYRILAESSVAVGVDRLLIRLHERRRRRAA